MVDLSEKRRERACKATTIALLILVIIISSWPFLTPYAPYGNDTEFHITRIHYLAQALANGDFPARMQAGWLNNSGYPISIMYGDLLLYPAAFCVLLGMSITEAYNATIIATNIASTLIAYASFKVISKSRMASTVGTTVWILSYMHLIDSLARGAVGELQASLFYPLIACGIYLLFSRDERNSGQHAWAWLSIGASGIIYTHVLSTLMVLFVTIPALVVGLFIRHDRSVGKNLLMAAGATLAMSAAFIVPFLDFYLTVEMRVNSPDAVPFENWTVEPVNDAVSATALNPAVYLNAFVGMGYSSIMTPSFGLIVKEIGLSLIVIFLGSIVCAIVYRRKMMTRERSIVLISLLAGFALLLFMISDRFPWWNDAGLWGMLIKPLLALQFTWRLLLPASFMMALVAVLMCAWMQKANVKITPLVSVILVIIAVSEGAYSVATFASEEDLLTPESVTARYDNKRSDVSVGEYLPKTASRFYKGDDPFYVDGIDVESYGRDWTDYEVTLSSESGGTAFLPMFFYKYQVLDTSSFEGDAQIYPEEGGFIGLQVAPESRGTLTARFEAPLFWDIALLVSYISVFSLAVFYGRILFKKRAGKNHAIQEQKDSSAAFQNDI